MHISGVHSILGSQYKSCTEPLMDDDPSVYNFHADVSICDIPLIIGDAIVRQVDSTMKSVNTCALIVVLGANLS